MPGAARGARTAKATPGVPSGRGSGRQRARALPLATASAGSSSADAAVAPLGRPVAPAASAAGSAGGRPRREMQTGCRTTLLPAARSREICRVAGRPQESQDDWHLRAQERDPRRPGLVCKGSGPHHLPSKAVAFQEGEGPRATALRGEPQGPEPCPPRPKPEATQTHHSTARPWPGGSPSSGRCPEFIPGDLHPVNHPSRVKGN